MHLIYRAVYGDATVDVYNDGSVTVNDRPTIFSKTMKRMMLAMAEMKGAVVTNRMMLSALYLGRFDEPEQKIIDVYICHIRSALNGMCSGSGRIVRCVWGRGYALGEPEASYAPLPIKGAPAHDCRWVPSRKLFLVNAIEQGRVTEQQVLARYPDLSATELREWMVLLKRHGIPGLRITRTQVYEAHLRGE